MSATRHIIEADLKHLRAMVKPFVLTMSAIFLLVIVISFTASWFWAGLMIDKAQNASLWQIGLQINRTPNRSVLLWDPSHLELITCQSGKTSQPCLRMIKKD